MTSPETPTPPPEPPPARGIFGDGSWRGIVPLTAVLGFFVAVLGGMFSWLDSRITDGIDGVERRLTAQIVEVKMDLSNRIDGVETRLSTRIDEVKADLRATESRLSGRIDEVKAELKSELAASEARRAAVDAQLSADIERVAAGVAENRLAHREFAAFVRASLPANPSPATAEQGAAPAQ